MASHFQIQQNTRSGSLTEQTPLQKSKGAVRNLTFTFQRMKTKEVEYDPRDRFKPLKSTFLQALASQNESYSGLSSPQEMEKVNDNVKLLPMSTKASSNDESVIEYGKRFLPPLWVDIQEEIDRHIDEITGKMQELKKLQQKRLKVNFVDDDDDESTISLQKNINQLASDITDLVRASETKLKELMRYQSEDKNDEQIRKNIQIQLAGRLKDLTQQLRKREKKHYLKVQEIHDDEGSRVYRTNREKMDTFLNDEGEMQTQQQLEEEEDLGYATQRHKNKEIQNLVSTINDLAVLFKELSVLVVEQGTILDRIDFNIEEAHKDTKQAVVHLEKTVKIEKSMRGKGVIGCLVASILVCLILLTMKHI